MANIKSAKKRIRVIDKKTARNTRVKNHVKEAEKAFLAAVESGDQAKAPQLRALFTRTQFHVRLADSREN